MRLFHFKELRLLLQKKLLEMLVRGIHVVVYFVVVVYLNLLCWKELRDLLQDQLLEMFTRGLHVVVYFVTVAYLHLYLDFARHQGLLLDH